MHFKGSGILKDFLFIFCPSFGKNLTLKVSYAIIIIVKNDLDKLNRQDGRLRMKEGLTIGQAADMLGCSISTLKRWEREGVLDSPDRHSLGWRIYNPEDIQVIKRLITSRKERKQS